MKLINELLMAFLLSNGINQRIKKYECIDCGFKSKFIPNYYKKSLNFRDELVIEALLR